MLFNSYVYLFLFFPAAAAGYFLLTRLRLIRAATMWLTAGSLAFYAYWNPSYLPLFAASILFNYWTGRFLGRAFAREGKASPAAKIFLVAAILVDLAPLLWYKYANFIAKNVNWLFGSDIPGFHTILPLAISFFTFQQIAFLVDSYQGKAHEYDFHNYCVFITFFPHLIAGPIIHHKEMIPQFIRLKNKVLNDRNLAMGLTLFAVGLFKKTIVADTFAVWANAGFDSHGPLTLIEAWLASLSYTLQLYFDFSGYSDMALGSALVFNIKLPVNFNSPYQAEDIQDFWRRWHMTLSRWLRDYLYIPMGGNRLGRTRTYLNLFLTFLIGGIWHGAGWTFIIWGAMHGLACAARKAWQDRGFKMPRPLAWFATFQFVNLAWVFFRATSIQGALRVLKGMAGLSGVVLPLSIAHKLPALSSIGVSFGPYGSGIPSMKAAFATGLVLTVCVFARNSIQLTQDFRPSWKYGALVFSLLLAGVLGIQQVSTFLYFEF